MSMVLDWFFGENIPVESSFRWLNETSRSNSDSAPILKLISAIVQQAVSDRANRIDLCIGIPELEYPTVESPDSYMWRKERELASQLKRKVNAEFARFMANAGVEAISQGLEPIHEEKLTVFYWFGEFRYAAMTIPQNLVLPIIRAYPYFFNFHMCSSTAKPENLLYVSTKKSAGFAAIDHYDRTSDHKLGICLEYED